jgi:hypothetical protein
VTHYIAKKALIAMVIAVALAVPAVSATANSGDPLIVPSSSTEHVSTDVMVAPTSSSEHSAPAASTALIAPVKSTEHGSVSNAAVIATGSQSSHFQDRWAPFGVAGLLLAVLIAAAMAIRFGIRGRGATV